MGLRVAGSAVYFCNWEVTPASQHFQLNADNTLSPAGAPHLQLGWPWGLQLHLVNAGGGYSFFPDEPLKAVKKKAKSSKYEKMLKDYDIDPRLELSKSKRKKYDRIRKKMKKKAFMRVLALFAQADRNEDGFLTKKEFRRVAEDIVGDDDLTMKTIQRIFNAVDQDDSGKVNVYEFLKWAFDVQEGEWDGLSSDSDDGYW